jgi:hypothetical protein
VDFGKRADSAVLLLDKAGFEDVAFVWFTLGYGRVERIAKRRFVSVS